MSAENKKNLFDALIEAQSDGVFPPHFHLPLREFALINIGTDRILTGDEKQIWHKTSVIHYMHRKFGMGADVEKIPPALLSPAFLQWLNAPMEGEWPLPVTRYMYLVATYLTPYDRLYNLKSERSIREFYADFVTKYAIASGFPPGLLDAQIFEVLGKNAEGCPTPSEASFLLSTGMAHIWRQLVAEVPFEPANVVARADFLSRLFQLMAMTTLDLRLLPPALITYLNAPQKLGAGDISGLMLEVFRLAQIADARMADPQFAEAMQRQFFQEIYPTLILPASVQEAHQKRAEKFGLTPTPRHILQQERFTPKFVWKNPAPEPKNTARAAINILERDEEYSPRNPTTEQLLNLCAREKFPCTYISAPYSAWKKQRGPARYEAKAHADINLFQARLDDLADFMLAQGLGLFEGRYNIGYCSWETDRLPQTFKQALHLLDEIWVASAYERDLFKAATDKPVHIVPLPVTALAPAAHINRRALNLPEKAFLFLNVFDCMDWLSRKNPLGVAEAFLKAFPNEKDVGLVFKTRYIEKNLMSREEGHILRLLARCDKDPRIAFIHKDITDAEMAGLIDATDASVALHRCSGFGRFLAESMVRGKPVIATSGSGPADFINNSTAIPVQARACDVVFESYAYLDREIGHKWWEADRAEAASAMRRLYEDRKAAAALGQQGKKAIQAQYSEEVCARLFRTRIQDIQKARGSALTHAA
jgi:glycosyltransferase involved in cell wall biosynthesis